jgi:predicted GIY-YIG superfamily endonuclease
MNNHSETTDQKTLLNENWYVYILKCNDMKYYYGCTSNLEKRLEKHQNGLVTSTKYRIPVKLEMYLVFSNKYTAYKFEKYLKSGSGRAFTKKHLLE